MGQTDSTGVSTPAPAPGAGAKRPSLLRYLATSDNRVPRLVRWLYALPDRVHIPAPRVVVKPLFWAFLLARWLYYFFLRVLVCEPIFKCYCRQYGKRLHTGTFIHWVQGKGDIILGDDVWLDGKCSIAFARRFADRPRLEIGNNSGMGHGCELIVGKRIRIGDNTVLSGHVRIADSNAHPTDVKARLAHLPPADDEVREVVIGDGVWIGVHVLIFPGVRIGDGAVVSTGSVVHSHVPPYSVVAGNPARVVFRLKPPENTASQHSPDHLPPPSTVITCPDT